MAINKATLAKEVDGVIEYIYPKTSADIVVYNETHSVGAMIASLVSNKVDKEDNKGLSTNDFTDAFREKLTNLYQTENIDVDNTLSDISLNPVQNRIITAKLNYILKHLGVNTNITIWNPTTPNGVDPGAIPPEEDPSSPKPPPPLQGIGDGTVVGAIKYIINTINGNEGGTVGGKLAELSTLGSTLGDIIVALERNKEPKHRTISYTLLASGWQDGNYSLEEEYPHSRYNLYIDKGINITKQQIAAFANANISSNLTANILTASGKVPTVDIPILLEIVDSTPQLPPPSPPSPPSEPHSEPSENGGSPSGNTSGEAGSQGASSGTESSDTQPQSGEEGHTDPPATGQNSPSPSGSGVDGAGGEGTESSAGGTSPGSETESAGG